MCVYPAPIQTETKINTKLQTQVHLSHQKKKLFVPKIKPSTLLTKAHAAEL